MFGLPELRRKARFCAVSSTSGTATDEAKVSALIAYLRNMNDPLLTFLFVSPSFSEGGQGLQKLSCGIVSCYRD